jgi:hypothetical protein
MRPLLRIMIFSVMLAPHPTPKLEDHLLSATSDCLLNIFVATLHIEGCSSIRDLRICHSMLKGAYYHGNEHSGYKKCAVFWLAENLLASQERLALCSKEVNSKETGLEVNADKTKYEIRMQDDVTI